MGAWQFEDARKLIDRIAANGWKVPYGIKPSEYKPTPHAEQQAMDTVGWGW